MLTPIQLKETNLIFSEHRKLLIENTLLYQQLDNYKLDNKQLCIIDSLKNKEIDNYKALSNSYQSQIDNLNKKIKKKTTLLTTFKISSMALLLFILLK